MLFCMNEASRRSWHHAPDIFILFISPSRFFLKVVPKQTNNRKLTRTECTIAGITVILVQCVDHSSNAAPDAFLIPMQPQEHSTAPMYMALDGITVVLVQCVDRSLHAGAKRLPAGAKCPQWASRTTPAEPAWFVAPDIPQIYTPPISYTHFH